MFGCSFPSLLYSTGNNFESSPASANKQTTFILFLLFFTPPSQLFIPLLSLNSLFYLSLPLPSCTATLHNPFTSTLKSSTCCLQAYYLIPPFYPTSPFYLIFPSTGRLPKGLSKIFFIFSAQKKLLSFQTTRLIEHLRMPRTGLKVVITRS